jgi:hypothetical protein
MERSLALAEQAGLDDTRRPGLHPSRLDRDPHPLVRPAALVRPRHREVRRARPRGLAPVRPGVPGQGEARPRPVGRGGRGRRVRAAVRAIGAAAADPRLTVLGLVRARRGDQDRWAALDEAAAEAKGQREPQYRVPVATARAEAAWLDGRGAAAVREETGEVLALAADRGAGWVVGELAWLRRLAGLPAGTEARRGRTRCSWRRPGRRRGPVGRARLPVRRGAGAGGLRRRGRPAAGRWPASSGSAPVPPQRSCRGGCARAARGASRAARAAPPGRIRSGSRPGRPRCSRCSARARRTPRSPPSCSCPSGPSSTTSRPCCASSGRQPRPGRVRGRPAGSRLANDPDRGRARRVR